jgi:hypothetical protein
MAFPQVTFVEAKHKRDQGGRFAGMDHGNTPSFSPKRISVPPMRSMTRGESWQRTGIKIAELPTSYTGSRDREMPVGSFTHHSWKPQIPAKGNPADHERLVKSLVSVIQANKPGTISRAQEQGLIPEGTPRRTVLRAFHHASLLGLHDYGVGKYDFKMDDDLKAEMKPLEGFMRYARRRVKSSMLGTERGGWRPYRAEFGQSFPTPKIDKRPDSPTFGQERKRVPPNDVLVKVAAAMPPAMPRPGVIPANAVGPGVSRFDRYRAYLARNEAMGMRSHVMLTPAQKLQRLKAGIAERRKVQTGAPKLQPGMPGSLAGDDIHRTRNPALPPSQPMAPAAPGMKKIATALSAAARGATK